MPRDEEAQFDRDSTTCRCGNRKLNGSRTCRPCFEAGRGVKPGHKGASLESLLATAKLVLKEKGESITIDGLTITKT